MIFINFIFWSENNNNNNEVKKNKKKKKKTVLIDLCLYLDAHFHNELSERYIGWNGTRFPLFQ